jgi:hypothetical protein
LGSGLGSSLIETLDVLLGALQALVELLCLTIEVGHFTVQSPDRPHKPQAENGSKNKAKRYRGRSKNQRRPWRAWPFGETVVNVLCHWVGRPVGQLIFVNPLLDFRYIRHGFTPS